MMLLVKWDAAHAPQAKRGATQLESSQPTTISTVKPFGRGLTTIASHDLAAFILAGGRVPFGAN